MMFEDCSYWISRLQPRSRGLTEEECFNLWSKLGELRFHLWSKTLPRDECDKIESESKRLQEELSEAVVRYTAPYASRSGLIVRLETGMMRVIDEMRPRIDEAEHLLRKRDLAEDWDQTEFDMFIQDPMDNIGYLRELLKAMKLSLGPNAIDAMTKLELRLRRMFPEAVHQYRQSGHYPIDANRAVFPESFWWRKSKR